MGGVPPLVVRFGAGGRGLVCLADSLSPAIRSFLAGFVSGDALDELDSWGALLFQDRLRDELSPYVVLMARHFFTLLLEIYISAARNKLPRAVLIMEDILKADDMAARLFLEIYDSLERKAELRIFGTCHTSLTTDDDLKKWSRVFPQVVLYSRKDVAFQGTVQMPRELWEISYGFSLLGKYFPGFLFSQILAEEGIGNAMFEKALDMFISLGVADTREDPRPRIPGFASRVEYFLDDHRKEKVRALVRNRILAWISAGKIRPCFNLLKILSDLGWKRNDALILMAIRGDISNGTYLGIDEALRKNSFNLLVGEDNAQELRYIFQTMKALVHGDKAQIRKAFEQSVPGTPVSRPFSGYRAQIQANLVSYHLGMKELDAAAETVKKAMLLNQSLSDAAVPAYRLFSLVNLSKQQIDEALEYFSFALDHAERMKQFDELGIAAYFAAGAQFLFGNLARAERYALQSEQSSRALGRGEWADRSRFLRGKLRFEVGHYEEALEIFESLRRGGEEGILRDKDLTISAWTYRSKVFMAASGGGKFEKPSQPRFLKGDALLFEIEACYLARDYKRVLTLSAESQEACMMDDDFLFTEQPDWRSGFAQCELLSIPGNVLWDRMISVYAALARCHLTTSPDEKADILNSMQRFMRDEFIPDADPNAAVYLYVWYLILQASGAAQVDKNTAVSMAFKRLQLRASRIDDPETRRDYLNLHSGNGALSLAAKEYNLI
jgi:hypothetical protein